MSDAPRRRLRVGLRAESVPRRGVLSDLVAAAGHDVVADSPDVVVATLESAQGRSPVPLVVLSDDLSHSAFEESWAGLLAGSPSPVQLDAALRAAATGLLVRAPGRAGFRSAPPPSSSPVPPLTPREVEILAAVGNGLSNKAVARRLGISAHTVKFHLETVFRKLGAESRTDALAKGLLHGLVEL